MTDVRLPFSEFEDRGDAARQLLRLAGDDPSQVRTHDDAFVVSQEFAEKHNLLEGSEVVVDLPSDAEPGTATSEEPAASGTDSTDTSTQSAAEAYDPTTRNVDEVAAYLADADEAERQRVLEAEAAGKKRKGILEWKAE